MRAGPWCVRLRRSAVPGGRRSGPAKRGTLRSVATVTLLLFNRSMGASKEWDDLMKPGEAADFFLPPPMPPFNLANPQFDAGVALWLSEFCRLSYRLERPSGKQDYHSRADILLNGKNGWSELHFFDGLKSLARKRSFWRPALPADDTQAMLAQNSEADCVVLAFRGTLGVLDLLTDLAFLAWPLRFKLRGSVHHGFSAALDSIWEEVVDVLARTPGKIILTGHSLGAALAVLAACRLLSDEAERFRSRLACLYTFGCPRVGTEGFESNLEGLYHARIVHEDDLVAQVPPAFSIPPFPRYKHVGRLHRLFSSGEIDSNFPENHDVDGQSGGMFETRSLLKRIIDEVRSGQFGPPIKSLKDHTPLLYSQALRAALQRTPR